jgi:hypothetical protein
MPLGDVHSSPLIFLGLPADDVSSKDKSDLSSSCDADIAPLGQTACRVAILAVPDVESQTTWIFGLHTYITLGLFFGSGSADVLHSVIPTGRQMSRGRSADEFSCRRPMVAYVKVVLKIMMGGKRPGSSQPLNPLVTDFCFDLRLTHTIMPASIRNTSSSILVTTPCKRWSEA